VEALWLALTRGRPGAIYNIGGRSERTNREVADRLLALLGLPSDTVEPVPDRPGHDRRYAIDPSRAERELGFVPQRQFDEGLAETVAWYRGNRAWWEAVKSGEYREFYQRQYPHMSGR
jgi:dTDP-glucose 4,6-dehydratase